MHSLKNSNKSSSLILKQKNYRKFLKGTINHSEYGLFANCYSQPKYLVEELCKENSQIAYNNKTRSHELGQWTVDVILSALNALPNVKAWQTPNNSIADVNWKWDVIIEHEDYFYPVQVKSGLDAIRKSQENLSNTLDKKLNKLYEKLQSKEQKSENKIERCISKYRLTSSKNATIVSIQKDNQQKIAPLITKIENYSKSRPLYIWASRDEDTVRALTKIFAELFSITDVLEYLQNKALTLYQEKNQKHNDNLVEEENCKIEYIREVINILKKYQPLKELILVQKNQARKETNQVVLLEDILSLKIAEKTLLQAEKVLKKSESFLKRIINDYSNSRFTDKDYFVSKDVETIEIYNNIKKLIYFCSTSNSSMLNHLNHLLLISRQFADKYDLQIIQADKHKKDTDINDNLQIFYKEKQDDTIYLNSLFDGHKTEEYGM